MTEEGFIGSQGKGKLISQEYVYDGEFEKGLAHGYGHFISPGVEYVGEFREGVPLGEGIGKTARGARQSHKHGDNRNADAINQSGRSKAGNEQIRRFWPCNRCLFHSTLLTLPRVTLRRAALAMRASKPRLHSSLYSALFQGK